MSDETFETLFKASRHHQAAVEQGRRDERARIVGIILALREGPGLLTVDSIVRAIQEPKDA